MNGESSTYLAYKRALDAGEIGGNRNAIMISVCFDPEYRKLVDKLRRQPLWPGHGGPAFSRYPNLAAELAARGWSLDTPCRAASVSGEVMAGVIEDGDKLSDVEIYEIAKRMGLNVGYLRSPVLSHIDLTTRKGKTRLHELAALMSEAIEHQCTTPRSRETLYKMEHGHPVTFAEWRRACWELRDQLEEYPQRPIRTTKYIQAKGAIA